MGVLGCCGWDAGRAALSPPPSAAAAGIAGHSCALRGHRGHPGHRARPRRGQRTRDPPLRPSDAAMSRPCPRSAGLRRRTERSAPGSSPAPLCRSAPRTKHLCPGRHALLAFWSPNLPQKYLSILLPGSRAQSCLLGHPHLCTRCFPLRPQSWKPMGKEHGSPKSPPAWLARAGVWRALCTVGFGRSRKEGKQLYSSR